MHFKHTLVWGLCCITVSLGGFIRNLPDTDIYASLNKNILLLHFKIYSHNSLHGDEADGKGPLTEREETICLSCSKGFFICTIPETE